MEVICNHRHDGSAWKSCALCRSLNHSRAVLYRSSQRQIDWPKSPADNRLIEEPAEYTSVDEAFSSVLQYMMTASQQCHKYLKTSSPKSLSHKDCQHLRRFHSSATQIQQNQRNPIMSTEQINIQIQPGCYVVTAGEQSTGQTQKHVVNVEHGQSVQMDFVMQ